MKRLRGIALGLLAGLWLSGCAEPMPAATPLAPLPTGVPAKSSVDNSAVELARPDNDNLYLALGERAGIKRIVEGMLLRIAHDPRIVEHFRHVDIGLLRDRLVEQLCILAGGPCVYKGASMAESHKGQHLTPSDFNALVEDLIDAMDNEHIPVPAQNRLLAHLAAMRSAVINK